MTHPEALALLRQAPLFSGLSEPALAGLAAHLRRRTFRRGTMIFHKDQAGDALYIIDTGRVRIFLPRESGGELTVEVASRGEVFGELALLDGGPRSASAESLDDVVLWTISRADFTQTVQTTPQLAVALIELLSRRLRHVTEYAESLAFLDVHARLAQRLLELGERDGVRRGEAIEISFDLTQTDLATMVGATRERVNRALASFRAQGLIELRGRTIVLLDPARLRRRVY
ncbi:MAG TPA: Crp/Fnr family transcriptional regulator [bacterium]|nr:Crp/Fnr family transcriptional regulator [bacterium]